MQTCFLVSDRYDGSCNAIDEPSSKGCVPSKTKCTFEIIQFDNRNK